MPHTYTYTARNALDPEKIVTFTLYQDSLSVSPGAPLEQIEAAVATVADQEAEAPEADMWLKPLAISLVERGTAPLSIADVNAEVDANWLEVQGWVRVGGLRLFPLTLTEGPVDNPDAARAFVDELEERKAEYASPVMPFDYWFTWIGVFASLITFFVIWRRRASQA